MDLEDGHPALEVGPVHDDPPVKTAGTEQCLVQDLGPVGGADDQDTLGGIETIHFRQELVEGLFPLFVAAAEPAVSAAADGVDLVNENDTGGVLGRLLEQIPDTGSADTDIKLDKIRAGQGKERHMGFAGYGLGQQGLACAGRAYQQGSLGELGADARVTLGIVEEVHDFLQGFLGLVLSGHILKGDAGILLDIFLGCRLAYIAHQAAAAHSGKEEAEQEPHQGDGYHIREQNTEQIAGAVRDICLHCNALALQAGRQSGIVLGLTGILDRLAVPQVDLQPVGLDLDLLDLALFHILQKFRIGDLLLLGVALHEPADGRQGDQSRDQQDEQILPGLLSARLTAAGIVIAASVSPAAVPAAAAGAAAVIVGNIFPFPA